MSDPAHTVEETLAATMRTYDVIAGAYAARQAMLPPYREERAELLAARLPAGSLVADLGCGPGDTAEGLQRRGLRVLGLDLSAAMTEIARSRGPVVRGDLRRPPFAAGSLDAVVSVAALLHVARAETAATLAAWRVLLRPGGLLVLSTAVGEGERWEPVPYAPDHHRWYVYLGARELLDAVTAAGFEIERASRRTEGRDWIEVVARA